MSLSATFELLLCVMSLHLSMFCILQSLFSISYIELQQMDLSPLAELPEFTKHALFQKLRETLKDRTALSYLQSVVSYSDLAQLCQSEKIDQVSARTL